jgi:hypothetical protein
MDRILDYDNESISTIPLNEAIEYHEDSLSYEEDPVPQNTHLYFDDDGQEITREEFLEQERQQEWAFQTSEMPDRFVIRHPRVLLHFLRFIDSLNEINTGDETYLMRAIPCSVVSRMLTHRAITDPPVEFMAEANELIERLANHADLS